MRFNCNGCGNEFDLSEAFPQGKERYCRMCNKKYPIFHDYKRQMYAAFDKAKEEEVSKKKLEVFGTKEQVIEKTERYMTEPKGNITEQQRAKLDRSLVNEGVPASDPIESFDPSIQPMVEEISKKIRGGKI